MTHFLNVLLHAVSRLIREKENRGNRALRVMSYCLYSLKYFIFWRILRIPMHFEWLAQFNVKFFHYSIFLSLFEDLYLRDEYGIKLRKKPTIIDLGSEVGLSVFYFKYLYPHAKILAFEPDPPSFRLLARNIRHNGIKNVFAFNVAASDKMGTSPFFVDKVVHGSLIMSLSPRRQSKKILVKSDKVSRYITEDIDLLKMDIEGAEYAVLCELAGSKKLRRINNLIIEYHHHIDENENTLSKTLSILEKEGFGYQIQAKMSLPFKKKQYQDCLIFAYRVK